MKYFIFLFFMVVFGCNNDFQSKYQILNSQVDYLLVKTDYLILESKYLVEKNECSK